MDKGNINENDTKVFFTAGDVVTLKQGIMNVPKMIVKSIDKTTIKHSDARPTLFGITCFWFTETKQYQSERFNTKDLIHCNG